MFDKNIEKGGRIMATQGVMIKHEPGSNFADFMVRRGLLFSDFVDFITIIAGEHPHGMSDEELRVQLHNNHIDFDIGEYTAAIEQALVDRKIGIRFKIHHQSKILLPYFSAIKK